MSSPPPEFAEGSAAPRDRRGAHRHRWGRAVHPTRKSSAKSAAGSPHHHRGIEVRGRAEAIPLLTSLIRIHPERIVSWGLGPGRNARSVTRSHP